MSVQTDFEKEFETEDGIIYNYTITISIDGSNVNFKAEDDLPK